MDANIRTHTFTQSTLTDLGDAFGAQYGTGVQEQCCQAGQSEEEGRERTVQAVIGVEVPL